jgi:23S rRNA A1618 N6-methylase RlmF
LTINSLIERKEAEDDSRNFTLDWRNEDAIRELSVAIIFFEVIVLLFMFFFKFPGIVQHYEIPKGYLCPRIPSRMQYMKWVNDLVLQTSHNSDMEIKGFDV